MRASYAYDGELQHAACKQGILRMGPGMMLKPAVCPDVGWIGRDYARRRTALAVDGSQTLGSTVDRFCIFCDFCQEISKKYGLIGIF